MSTKFSNHTPLLVCERQTRVEMSIKDIVSSCRARFRAPKPWTAKHTCFTRSFGNQLRSRNSPRSLQVLLCLVVSCCTLVSKRSSLSLVTYSRDVHLNGAVLFGRSCGTSAQQINCGFLSESAMGPVGHTMKYTIVRCKGDSCRRQRPRQGVAEHAAYSGVCNACGLVSGVQ